MITETISVLTEPTKGVLQPVHKLNQQAVATIEQLATHQIDSLKGYSELGVSQLKAVAEVRDVEGLRNLLYKQTDVLSEVADRLMSDIKAIFQMGAGFLAESTKVGTEVAKAS